LIADIYLKFGILLKGKSNEYWPKDFENNDLPLNTNYNLSPIMNVDFNKAK
jgi:hypothetical protein